MDKEPLERIAGVVAPPMEPLSYEELFGDSDLPNLEVLMEHLLKEGRLDERSRNKLINDAAAVLRNEPNLLKLEFPMTVVGDIHGQFFDLAGMFAVGGAPTKTRFLFLGDYVDRGCFSTEVIFFLFALKLTRPNDMWMLRGNHECRQLTSFFNFKDECIYKYDEDLYNAIMNAFDCLPLGAVLADSFFCVHGGLSPDIHDISEIDQLDRFHEVPVEGPLCDLVWSDPYDEEQGTPHKDDDASWFAYNDTRKCSYVFGAEAVKQFLQDNKLQSIVRAHEAQDIGYKLHFVDRRVNVPGVITVFSAPNYCDVYKNKAAVLKFNKNVLNIKQFVEAPHPYYLPNFMDVFQWSLPFVAEKITDMLAGLLEHGHDDGEDDKDELITEKQAVVRSSLHKKAPKLKQKIKAVTKILRMYKMLRSNNETLVQLKQLAPNNKIPCGLLTQGTDAIKKALSDFKSAKQADSKHERRPTDEGVTSQILSSTRSRTREGSERGSDDLESYEVYARRGSLTILEDLHEIGSGGDDEEKN